LKPLVRESLLITKELGNVIFIGAIARYFHTNLLRESQDIDFALEKPISNKELNDKGYNQFSRNGKLEWFTPRGIKIDMYIRDVSKIPIGIIIKTSKNFTVGKVGDLVRVIGLEPLIVAKHRAQRDADIEDLQALAKSRFKEIKWDVLEKVAKDKHEFESVRTTMTYLSRL
jgi:predicted nucleotidyltransferase